MKVKTIKYGIIHGVARCSECDWESAIRVSQKNRMQSLRNRIYYHVKKTGHRVTLETGNSTDYLRKE